MLQIDTITILIILQQTSIMIILAQALVLVLVRQAVEVDAHPVVEVVLPAVEEAHGKRICITMAYQ